MKAKSLNISHLESLIEDLSDEELASCSGGLVSIDLMTSQKVLSVSTDSTTGTSVHTLPDSWDLNQNLNLAGVGLETDPSVRATTRAY